MRPPLIPQPVPIHEHEQQFTRILKTCYNHLVEYREPKTNRIIISLFMCLPSRKDFPEYFDIIERPISMYEIRKRIEQNLYRCEDDCIDDFKLMFNNCRFFNEDASQIFKDAEKLEDMLLMKYEQLLREANGGRATVGSSGSISRHLGANNGANNSSPAQTQLPTSTPTRRVERGAAAPANSNNTSTNTNTNNHHLNKHASTPDISSPSINNKHNITTSTSKQQAKNNVDSNHNHSQQQNSGNHNYHLQHQQQQQQQQHNQISHSNQSTTNGIPSDLDSNSNSNNYSISNGGGSTEDSSFIINHNFHNDASIDSNSNLSIGPNSSQTSLPSSEIKSTKRQKKDPDAPKKRLLTGYIIYAAEVRKEYVDKNPNQDFGFISRLIGNDWKALSTEARKSYDQRASAHNLKMREKAVRDSMLTAPDGQPPAATPLPSALMTNGTSTPKMTKRKLAKLAREQAKMLKSSSPYPNQHANSFTSPMRQQDGRPSQMGPQTATSSSYRSSDFYNPRYTYSTPQTSLGQHNHGKAMTTESATQTAPIRFVAPPTKRRFAYNENFRRYIESLEVPNTDLLAEETAAPPSERPPEPATKWLGAGTGRHGSAEAALWALRDFMLQDSGTMRWNMQPYLCY